MYSIIVLKDLTKCAVNAAIGFSFLAVLGVLLLKERYKEYKQHRP
tara:strand:- start:117 stop:251 length:135 start_codon:yes stop_codon:yes gene_type:complete